MKKFLVISAVIALVTFAIPAFSATSPFMDVPAGHWSYDAVAQLAATGVASGYPDGSYKGAQPATRYEMASMVARVLALFDMEKASKQDTELLKRLVLEFKNELDALGVNVNDLDKRVAALEDGISGWKIRGIFRFDAKIADSKNEFVKDRFRLYLTKTIDENTYLFAEYRTGDSAAGNGNGLGDQEHMRWASLFVDTKLPWDMGLRVGRFHIDFEYPYGFYSADGDALFGGYRTDGFMLTKNFGILDVAASIGRNVGPLEDLTGGMGNYMRYVLNLNLRPNERYFIGATGYWGIEDSDVVGDWDLNTYAFYGGYNFTPNIALKGIYYFQDLGSDIIGANFDDSPSAWKVVLDIKQEALKFTSLWIEYMNSDNSFVNYNSRYGMYAFGGNPADGVMNNQPRNSGTTKVLFAKAGQRWTDKWGTFLRFVWANYDTTDLDNAYEYGIGVTYQYTPAIQFELAYNRVDYGSNNPVGYYSDKEGVLRFRTSVNF